MFLLLVFLSLALGVSFLCSILEAVVLSVTPSYIASEREQGSAEGDRWQHIKQNIDRSLAAILSLNTIAHTIGAAGVGAQASKVFGEAYFGVISGVLTLLILIFSEIIPKTVGANYWRTLAPICIPVLRFVELSMWPLVAMSQVITGVFSKGKSVHGISREEIASLAWMGEDQGILNSEESSVIRSIMRVRSLTAKDIMTPRTVLYSLNEASTVQSVVDSEVNAHFSRIPIYREQRDNIVGFVRKDDILTCAAQGRQEVKLQEFHRELLTALPNTAILTILQKMNVGGYQMCLVVGEFGDTLGIVTMEDVVETMLGFEIVDETDSCPDMQKLARTLWEKRAKQRGLEINEYMPSE